MIHKRSVDSSTSSSTLSLFVKWCSVSSPRPVVGISGVLYVNKDKNIISIWNDVEKKYYDFSGDRAANVTTNNSIVESIKENNSSNSYSFSLIDDIFTIVEPDGNILEVPIVDKSALVSKIQSLEERIAKLEELLG